MMLLNGLEQFHFLRPMLLLLLLPVLILVWVGLRKLKQGKSIDGLIAPHLQKALLLNQHQQAANNKPIYLFALLSVLLVIAMAGPAWRMQLSPFLQEQAATVIVLKVSQSMINQDIQPSRLQRGVQKIEDLLAVRQGAPHGLVAYSGSAHTVMPLTTDASAILFFARELVPEVMPSDGDNIQQAYNLAQQQIKQSGKLGSIIWISDSPLQLDASAVPVHWLPITSSQNALANGKGVQRYQLSADNSDIINIARSVKTSMQVADAEQGQRWQDEGYWLTPIIALLMLFWFRPGWVVRYGD